MNLVRDPRWGRAQEVYSEDPALTSALTYSFVTAIQERDCNGYMRAAACCKHYLAYDLETDPVERYKFNAVVNGRDMWETHLPAFDACVRQARGSHVMCSYNAVNGVPACGNNDTLNGILREKWGFEGFVVSDYDSWAQVRAAGGRGGEGGRGAFVPSNRPSSHLAPATSDAHTTSPRSRTRTTTATRTSARRPWGSRRAWTRRAAA